jgi:hypothetical protein
MVLTFLILLIKKLALYFPHPLSHPFIIYELLVKGNREFELSPSFRSLWRNVCVREI